MNEQIKSPCVRNCCLDDKDICLGCFRHIDEIVGWQQATDERKKDILQATVKKKEGVQGFT